MNEMVRGFKLSKQSQLMFQDVLDELPETYRETLIEAMASFSSELQLYLTGRILEDFRKELSKSLTTMMIKGNSNGFR